MSSYGLIQKIPGMKIYMPYNFLLYESQRTCDSKNPSHPSARTVTDIEECYQYTKTTCGASNYYF